MDYDPKNYCDTCCPGRPSWLGTDQPCQGEGHGPRSECVRCTERARRERQAEDRQVFTIIEQRSKGDPEYLARLQRHIDRLLDTS